MTRPQLLLNLDGSIPAGADIIALRALGIPMVLPTPMPRQPGMRAVEQDAEQGEDGAWRQVWALEPESPEAEPETESAPPIFG